MTIYEQVERERERSGMSRTELATAVGHVRGGGICRAVQGYFAREGAGRSAGGTIALLRDMAEAMGCEVVVRRKKGGQP